MIKIIGIGSDFGADTIAQHVIKLLKNKLITSNYFSLIELDYLDRPGIHLLEHMKNCKIVHLIDAIVSDKPIATIHRYEDLTKFQQNNKLLSSHGLGVAETLMLGQALQSLSEKLIIHCIEIDKTFDSISHKLIKSCHVLADNIFQEIAEQL